MINLVLEVLLCIAGEKPNHHQLFPNTYDNLFSRLHYEIPMDSPSTSFPCQYGQPNPFCDSPNNPPSSPSELTSLDGGYFGGGQHMNPGGAGPSPGVNMTGLPQQPRQKGRPRKRKPKDIDAMTASLGES